jgi:membrane-associated phospholipid phosphatase
MEMLYLKKNGLTVIFLCLFCLYAEGRETAIQAPVWNQTGKTVVPITMAFHNIGWNILHSVTYNCGFNFIAAGLGTWAFIETGIDWKWRNIAWQNSWLSNSGIPPLYIGYVVPGVTPVAAYITGCFIKDKKLQITGLALTQSLFLTLGIQAVLKMATGRALPGIITGIDHTRSSRTDDFSGEFNWFNMNFIGGYPSGHTANAFSAAAAIAEIYHDKPVLKIGMYTYAAIMGLCISVSVHWASEVFAGALIGYAIGKTVGKSYKKLMENHPENNKLAFYASYNTVGVIIRR